MTPVDVAIARLDQLISRQARCAGDTPALSAGGQCVTYSELESRIDACVEALRQHDIATGDRVGVLLPKGIDAIVAIYAIMRAGGVPAPLHPADPVDRLSRMAENAGLKAIICAEGSRAGLEVAESAPLSVPPRSVASGLSTSCLLRHLGWAAEDIAPERGAGYILFTSGSTGWPKGVLLSHRNVLHFATWMASEFNVRSTDVVGSQASLGFDLSTFDFFGGAWAGAHVTILPDYLRPFPRDALAWLESEHVSVLYAVPTFYRKLLESAPASDQTHLLPSLRFAAYAGEAFPADALREALDRLPHVDFANLYGPTETNVCTFRRIVRGRWADEPNSIGSAIAGVETHLLSDDAISDTTPELAVSGPTVMIGYLDKGTLVDPCVTIDRPDGSTVRAYRTGDLVEPTDRDELVLRGRADHQIKRNGHRIDLGDIESQLHGVAGIRDCAAVATSETDSTQIHVAVVPDTATEPVGLVDRVDAALPASMRPDSVIVVDALPLNDRGKIDRDEVKATLMEASVGQRR